MIVTPRTSALTLRWAYIQIETGFELKLIPCLILQTVASYAIPPDQPAQRVVIDSELSLIARACG